MEPEIKKLTLEELAAFVDTECEDCPLHHVDCCTICSTAAYMIDYIETRKNKKNKK